MDARRGYSSDGRRDSQNNHTAGGPAPTQRAQLKFERPRPRVLAPPGAGLPGSPAGSTREGPCTYVRMQFMHSQRRPTHPYSRFTAALFA
jgi:hypothetical protein